MGILDRFRSPKPQTKPRGGSGRAHTQGFLEFEELNADLAFPTGLRVYDKMYRTDPDVRRNVWMLVNPIIGGTWYVEPYGKDEAEERDQRAAEFVEWALFDRMRPRLPRHLAQALPAVVRWGFCPFEQVWMVDTYEGRPVLVPRTLSLRLPRSIQRFPSDGPDLLGIEQVLIDGGVVEIPAADLVYYRLGAEGDNWEGTSLLRAVYKPWLLKDRIERIDAIAQEREAVGVPLCYPPRNADSDTLDEIEEILAGLRTNEQGYIVAPGPHAENTEDGNGWRFEILSHKSSEQRSAEPSLKYHTDKIAAAFVAEFMRLGQAGEGARATADVQQDPFLAAVDAVASEIEDTLNEQLVQRIVALNLDVDEPPKLRHSLIDSTSLVELKDYVAGLIGSGALVADPPLEDYLRERGDLPPADPDERERRQTMRDEMDAAKVEQAKNPPPVPGEPTKPGDDPKSMDPGPSTKDKPDDKQLSRQDRPLRPYEQHMSLDAIETAIEDARSSFERAAGDTALALARDLAKAAGAGKEPRLKAPDELVEAIHRELEDLYALGRETVAEELERQKPDPTFTPGITLARAKRDQKGRMLKRARLSATAIVSEVWKAVSRLALIPGRDTAADLQFEAERASMFALRQEAQVHAAPALNEGREAEADDRSDEIRGSYYTSILDANACPRCARADDDVLRPLTDPVRLARIPPNPDCEGGSRCRCMESFVLTGEEPPSA